MINSPVDKIKERLELVEFIQGYVKLARTGVNFRGLCPFHQEKTPSFFVNPERQMWRCFGCNRGGDLFTFIIEHEGVDFKEALRMLAERAGVPLKFEPRETRSLRERVLQALEAAATFYETRLKEHQDAYKYLVKERGINPDSIAQFRVGFAPSDWRELKQALEGQGFKEPELLAAGLILKPTDGRGPTYDRFRGRIMLPIAERSGKIVGFSARLFEPAVKKDRDPGPKYLNTPSTIVYDKSVVLYGLDKARRAIRVKSRVLLVEGNLDVIMAHQAGVTEAVAPCGTALGPRHLEALRRLTTTLYMGFDMDAAGRTATERAITEALRKGFTVKVISYGRAKDAADVVKENPNALAASLDKAVEYLVHLVQTSAETHDLKTAQGKKSFASAVLPFVQALQSAVERGHWVRELSQMLDVEERFLTEAMVGLKPTTETVSSTTPISQPVPRIRTLEEHTLKILINYPQLLKNVKITNELFASPDLRQIFEEFSATGSVTSTTLLALYSRLAVMAVPADEATITEDLESCIKELERERLRARIRELRTDIRTLEMAKSQEELAAKTREFNTALGELRELTSI